jgi:Glycosyltransferase
MMLERGHTVIHLGNEGSNPPCTQHISVGDPKQWDEIYGIRKPFQFYRCDNNPYTKLFYENARQAILSFKLEPNTAIVCLTFGESQKGAVEGINQFYVESGIGYANTFHTFRVYESYAWMHHDMGKQLALWEGGKYYWSVIPNARDPEIYGPVTREKENFFLYIGRLNDDKGVALACKTAQQVGVPIKIIGQGNPARFLGPGIEYCPPMAPKEFHPLLAKAKGLFSPSIYPEPFGNIAVEAMLSGCPVITTDWGAYVETCLHGITGYRCRTRGQFNWAARNIDKIDPFVCRKWVEDNYSLNKVGQMYEEYFQSILNLKNPDGWENLEPNRDNLDWLNKTYPVT